MSDSPRSMGLLGRWYFWILVAGLIASLFIVTANKAPSPKTVGSSRPAPTESPPNGIKVESASSVEAEPAGSIMYEAEPAGSMGSPYGTYPPFPWPPPRASSKRVLDWELFVRDGSRPDSIGGVGDLLEYALDKAGYNETSYYPLTNGFALVTRLEEIDETGAPLPGQLRWPAWDKSIRKLTIAEYLEALLVARPGYFRVVVFILTDEPFATTGASPTEKQTLSWLSDGLNYLPVTLAEASLTKAHKLTALVYEFQKKRKSEAAVCRIPGRLAAAIHLRKSGVLIALERLK